MGVEEDVFETYNNVHCWVLQEFVFKVIQLKFTFCGMLKYFLCIISFSTARTVLP